MHSVTDPDRIRGALVVGGVILKGKKPYWGRPSTHYHQGMRPGDNTLNLLCARADPGHQRGGPLRSGGFPARLRPSTGSAERPNRCSSALRADERGASCRTRVLGAKRRRTLVRATRLRRYARLGCRPLRARHPRAGVAQLAPRSAPPALFGQDWQDRRSSGATLRPACRSAAKGNAARARNSSAAAASSGRAK